MPLITLDICNRMSKNIIHTIGQHVFRYDPPEYTEKGAPVFAKNPTPEKIKESEENKKEPKYQFLGAGFYFWDNNIKRAHRWGRQHYQNNYLILEIPLDLKGDNFLDLVGSREDLMKFLKAYRKIKKKFPGLKIGAFFHGMQTMTKNGFSAWPYKIIRALNVKSNASKIPFNNIPDSRMLLDPEIIICYYDKNELNLHRSRYLDKNNHTWTQKIS